MDSNLRTMFRVDSDGDGNLRLVDTEYGIAIEATHTREPGDLLATLHRMLDSYDTACNDI